MTLAGKEYLDKTLTSIQNIECLLVNYSMDPVGSLKSIRTELEEILHSNIVTGSPLSVLYRFIYRYVVAEISQGSLYNSSLESNLYGQMDGIRSVIAACCFEPSQSALKRLTLLPFWSDSLLSPEAHELRVYCAKIDLVDRYLFDSLPDLSSLGAVSLTMADEIILTLESAQPLKWLSSRFSRFEWTAIDDTEKSRLFSNNEGLDELGARLLREFPCLTLARQDRLKRHELLEVDDSLQMALQQQFSPAANYFDDSLCLSPEFMLPSYVIRKHEVEQSSVHDFQTIAGHICALKREGEALRAMPLARQVCVIEVMIISVGEDKFVVPKTSIVFEGECSDSDAIAYTASEGWQNKESTSFSPSAKFLTLKFFDQSVLVCCDHWETDFAIALDSQCLSNHFMNVWSTDHYGVLYEPSFAIMSKGARALLYDFSINRKWKSHRSESFPNRAFKISSELTVITPSDAVIEVVSADSVDFVQGYFRFFDKLLPSISLLGEEQRPSDCIVVFRSEKGYMFGLHAKSECYLEKMMSSAVLECELLYDDGFLIELNSVSDVTYFNWEAIANMAQCLIHMMSEVGVNDDF